MRYILVLCFIIFSFTPRLHSESLPDSILLQLEQSADSSKAFLLNNFVLKNYRSDPEVCLPAVKMSIEISKRLQQSVELSKAYSMAGVIYKNKGEFSTALEFHHKSLEINTELDNKQSLASNYNDIGIIYKTIKDYDKALESYLMANALATELGFKRGIVMTLSNIGTIHEAKGNTTDAIDYYKRAYNKALEFDIIDAQAIALNNLGEIYAKKGDEVTARNYFQETLRIDKKTKDVIGSVYSIMNIANTMVGTKEWDSAAYYYTQAEEIAQEMKANQLLYSIYASKSNMYEVKQDFRNAYLNFQKATLYQDSLYNESKQKQLAEAEARFEASTKDKEITLLKQERLIKEIEIQQHKAERFAYISLIILGSIIIFYLYKRYQNKQLQMFNARMLAQKENHLRAVVEAQEQERKRIAKDLHDGVGQSLTGVRLGLNAFKVNSELSEANKLKINDLTTVVDQTIQEVRTLSHQMMPRILQEDGLIPALSDMLEKSFRFSPIQYEFEHYGISDRFREGVEIGLYRISQELVNNIIKHSGANRVSVQLFKNGKYLVLLVEDNGKGFEMNELEKSGIGLMNITSRVETIQGEFNLSPSPQSGTLATIRIPIDK